MTNASLRLGLLTGLVAIARLRMLLLFTSYYMQLVIRLSQ